MVSPDTPVLEAISKINSAATGMALVVNSKNILLGTLSDGDIRRGLLAGMQMTDPVERCMCRTPTTSRVDEESEAVLSKMRIQMLRQIPIIDQGGRVVDIRLIDDYLMAPDRENWVVIMAGGKGSRLKELTRETPKPMLLVGDRPLLETSICRFVKQGFRNIWLAVNYHAAQVEDYFGDGNKLGAKINYLREDKRLGTAGALSLLPHRPERPILVTNGDLLINVDYADMVEAHSQSDAIATMAIRDYDYQIPYGVVRIQKENIVALDEKPVHRVTVNAGVYVLSPKAISNVPKKTFFDMPELIETLIRKGGRVCSHLIQGYWLDVGRHEDLAKACSDYNQVFDK